MRIIYNTMYTNLSKKLSIMFALINIAAYSTLFQQICEGREIHFS